MAHDPDDIVRQAKQVDEHYQAILAYVQGAEAQTATAYEAEVNVCPAAAGLGGSSAAAVLHDSRQARLGTGHGRRTTYLAPQMAGDEVLLGLRAHPVRPPLLPAPGWTGLLSAGRGAVAAGALLLDAPAQLARTGRDQRPVR